jgi:hypothetical protein
MRKSLVLVAALALSAALCSALYAQETPKAGALGMTGSVGTSYFAIGAWYNATDAIVIKPALGLWFNSDPDSNPAYKVNEVRLDVSLDGLYEIPIAGGLALGVGPHLEYYLDKTTYTYPSTDASISRGTFYIGVVASAQYFFTKSVGLYLDAGIMAAFYHYGPSSGTAYSTTTFQTYSNGLGVVFLLK